MCVYIYILIDHTWRLVFPMFFAVFCSIVPYNLYVFKRASGERLQGAHSKCHQLFAKLF